MIDDVVFTTEMTILQHRFGRKDMPEEVIARYLDFLAQHMDTAGFLEAARVIFNEDTFWPSPRRFVTALQGDPRQAAETAWQAIMRDARAGRYPPLESLPPAVRAALKVAPMREIMSADDYQLSRLKRDFLEEHVRASGGQASAQPRLERQDEDPLRLGS